MYSELLLRPEWLVTSNLVKARDDYKCQYCGLDNNLHVHHIKYIYNRDPWDYDWKYLITLCKYCHELEHKALIVLKDFEIAEHLLSGLLALDIISKVNNNEIIHIDALQHII